MILEETETVFLGNPGVSLTFDDSGYVYVPDFATNRVLVFGADGALSRILGRAGGGPGEFRAIGVEGLVIGSHVLYNDYRSRRINVFDRLGGPLAQIPYSGRLSGLHGSGDTIWVSAADHGSGLGVAPVHLPSILATSNDEDREPIHASSIALPTEYAQYRVLAWHDDVKLLTGPGSMIAAFGGLPYLVTYEENGAPVDTHHVPACRRHGSPPEVLDRWFRSAPRTREQQEGLTNRGETSISWLLGLWRLTDGKILVWYQDARWDPGRILRGTAYLSVLTPDLKRACVDAALPAEGSGRSRLGVFRDQVFLLDQVVDETGPLPRVQSVIHRYSISTDGCRWLPTSRTPEKG